MAGLYNKKYTGGKWEPKIKVTGGVSRIGYLLDPTGYLKGEGGLLLYKVQKCESSVRHTVYRVLPPLLYFWGGGVASFVKL
jgi:hypothetical protein